MNYFYKIKNKILKIKEIEENIPDFIEENKAKIIWLYLFNLPVVYGICQLLFMFFHEGKAAAFSFLFLWALFFWIVLLICIAKKLSKIVLYLIFLLSICLFFVDLFCLFQYRTLFDQAMLQVILETNPRESLEFLLSHLSFSYMQTAFLSISLIFLLYILLSGLLSFLLRFDKAIKMIVIFSLDVYIFFLFYFPVYHLNLFHVYHLAPSVFRVSWMIPFSVYDIYECGRVLQNVDNQPVSFTKNESTIPYVVFILGESTTRKHMGIYGYELDTTPCMEKREEVGQLEVFQDVVSPETYTLGVLKKLFTFYSNDSDEDEDEEKWYHYANLFSILKQADYYTVWISNQEMAGTYGNISRIYADLCNERHFTVPRDSKSFVAQTDEAVLPLLDMVLSEREYPKNFYVIHLMGTHDLYNRRYSKEYDEFQEKDESGKNEEQKKVRAEYDNAVLYNDFIVDSIIKRFEEKNAIVIYISDHGEDVYDDWSSMGHTLEGSHQQMEIPMLVWMSESFRENNPALVQRIHHAKELPFMTDHMMHALLDLMGIETKDYDASKSLFHPSFDKERVRQRDGKVYVK